MRAILAFALLAMPALPADPPAWVALQGGHRFFPCAAVSALAPDSLPALADDLTAADYAHAEIQRALATGQGAALDSDLAPRLERVLRDPGPTARAERALPYPQSYMVRDSALGERQRGWELLTAQSHQTEARVWGVLADPHLSLTAKTAALDRLQTAAFETLNVTPLPMNMAGIDRLPISGAFGRRFPRAQRLLWGGHWIVAADADLLLGTTPRQQRLAYPVLHAQWQGELTRPRPEMPMTADLSPAFAARFPRLANLMDNARRLHDLTLDILASDLTEEDKTKWLRWACWIFSTDGHRGERPGARAGGWHDHRFLEGMPGMGLGRGTAGDLMYRPRLGWMRPADCHHCGMPLPDGLDCPRVTVGGWTTRVRCALCARDLAAQTPGRAILHLPTEDPLRPAVLISDDRGDLTTDTPGVVFLEQEAGHASCLGWSRAFTGLPAFRRYVRAHPEYRRSPALTLARWSARQGRRLTNAVRGPVADPYRSAP